MDFLPSDVMEALIEEDMERLRARRKAASRPRHHQSGAAMGDMASPSGSTFSDSSVILGLGTGIGIRDVLPLKSRFYDWCCEYFKEPQMRVWTSLLLEKCLVRLIISSLATRS